MAYADGHDFTYSEISRLSAPGRYFVTVEATSEVGLGAYSLDGMSAAMFANQRDVPLYFFDFDQQVPEHKGRAWEASFQNTEAIPFLLGSFESMYDRFDVDVTTLLPNDRLTYISQGVGAFEGVGNAGSGSFGFRNVIGGSRTDASNGFPVDTINHEIGHASSLYHVRDPLQHVAWGSVGKTLFPGSDFGFSPREVAMGLIHNHIDQADLALQSGSQVAEPTATDDVLDLSEFLDEMSLEFVAGPQYDVGVEPHQVVSGDFDNDGNADHLEGVS